jgi:glycerophosphoryl diester phosphodiesterase
MNNKMNWITNMKIAHRGYHSPNIAPENSIRAFKNAIEEGFAIELDVHILKDENVVVFHDDNLERMTGYNKNIEECTYEEIRALKLMDTIEKIPLFSEVLTLVNGRVPLMIETKNRGRVGRLEQKLYDLLRTYSGDFVVQSFNPYSMSWFNRNAPEIIRGQLSGSGKNKHIGSYREFLLKNFLLNKISNPHFMNYEISYYSYFAAKIQGNKKIPVLCWTARSEENYIIAMKQCNNVIFEGFNPKNIKLQKL